MMQLDGERTRPACTGRPPTSQDRTLASQQHVECGRTRAQGISTRSAGSMIVRVRLKFASCLEIGQKIENLLL